QNDDGSEQLKMLTDTELEYLHEENIKEQLGYNAERIKAQSKEKPAENKKYSTYFSFLDSKFKALNFEKVIDAIKEDLQSNLEEIGKPDFKAKSEIHRTINVKVTKLLASFFMEKREKRLILGDDLKRIFYSEISRIFIRKETSSANLGSLLFTKLAQLIGNSVFESILDTLIMQRVKKKLGLWNNTIKGKKDHITIKERSYILRYYALIKEAEDILKHYLQTKKVDNKRFSAFINKITFLFCEKTEKLDKNEKMLDYSKGFSLFDIKEYAAFEESLWEKGKYMLNLDQYDAEFKELTSTRLEFQITFLMLFCHKDLEYQLEFNETFIRIGSYILSAIARTYPEYFSISEPRTQKYEEAKTPRYFIVSDVLIILASPIFYPLIRPLDPIQIIVSEANLGKGNREIDEKADTEIETHRILMPNLCKIENFKYPLELYKRNWNRSLLSINRQVIDSINAFNNTPYAINGDNLEFITATINELHDIGLQLGKAIKPLKTLSVDQLDHLIRNEPLFEKAFQRIAIIYKMSLEEYIEQNEQQIRKDIKRQMSYLKLYKTQNLMYRIAVEENDLILNRIFDAFLNHPDPTADLCGLIFKAYTIPVQENIEPLVDQYKKNNLITLIYQIIYMADKDTVNTNYFKSDVTKKRNFITRNKLEYYTTVRGVVKSAKQMRLYQKITSKKLTLQYFMIVAEKFLPYNAIYFPNKLDIRARIYPVTDTINIQNYDLIEYTISLSMRLA
ncbi:MAG TPA: hypothetical protein VD794_01885, partial [Flavisolibacter sp.]|nr:hypothetical protein [Flavisolibacter sp.]